jgi:hypothetical protein
MKKKILFLAANPTDSTRLALDVESREIQEKIRASEHRDKLEILIKGAVRPTDLLQYLHEHSPHIIHFSGHGNSSEELIFTGHDGKSRPVSREALISTFTTLQDNIRVVMLNACYSNPQAEAITEIIDCAIGMKRAIGDQAAIVFASAFYQAIGFGRSVKTAFEIGKSALLLEGIPEEKTPILICKAGVDPSEVFIFSPHENFKNPT